ncbi:MAG: hypothetical protein HY874_08400 [Chloroflexi bacterium]|nr:hypothetical protein [Chloroflexota bacterium]
MRERWYYPAFLAVMLVIGVWYGASGSALALIVLRLSLLPAIAIYGSEIRRQRDKAAQRRKAGPRRLGLLFIVSFIAFGVFWFVLSMPGIL